MSMSLIPWRHERRSADRPSSEPGYGIDVFERDMHRLFDDLLGHELGLSPIWTEEGHMGFIPRVDVVETDKEVRISAELPGMTEDDVELSVDDTTLIIRGEKRTESEQQEGNSYRMERSYGSFRRVVQLPSEVKADKAEAIYNNGVLTVTLPKAETSRVRKITVKHAS